MFAARRYGKNRNGSQRYLCGECGAIYSEAPADRINGTNIPLPEVVKVVQLLGEGCSIRSVERITGLHRDTILKLFVIAGEKCERLLGRMIVNVPVKEVESDEIWGFVGKKQKTLKPEDDPNFGDAYTFVAMERNTKLVLNFALGKRNQDTTDIFIAGLRAATSTDHFQLSTDGFAPYKGAVARELRGRSVDFAQIIKVYRATPEGECRYSPAEVVDTEVVPVIGAPSLERVCTSHRAAEPHNAYTDSPPHSSLERIQQEVENLWAALCLHFAFYNLCRIHRSLRVTPGMESKITDHVGTIEELLTTQMLGHYPGLGSLSDAILARAFE